MSVAPESELQAAALYAAQAQALLYAQDLRRVFHEERARRLELEQAMSQLEAESRRRADFVSLLAYELQVPLGTLVCYLELLTQGGFGPLGDQQQRALDLLARRAGDLADLVAELRQYAVLTSDEATTLTGPLLRLPDHLERVLSPVRSRADERAIELRLTTAVEGLDAEVDLGLVSLAAAQLADNAVRYGRPGGWAWVSVVQDGGQLELVVVDNGPGLAPAVRAGLLRDYQEGADLLARRQDRVGLGLTIVAHAARTLGAQLHLDAPDGRGSRIRLSIPLRAQAA
jgi:signal transduction histidine kinase